MKHLGDITKINGCEAPAVDCVIGGSPCQDLSLAGKRAGLAGARSCLYMEQIRIIKEMREADVLRGKADVDVRPRYMVWENVPGAFSTNGGKDFAAVLEEAIRVAEPEAPAVAVPEKGWPTSGCFWDEMGRWSIAWRVLDAQFWGTPDKPLPQRRRRIALVADFGGLSAPEILFVRQSVSGNLEPGKPEREKSAAYAQRGSKAYDREGECAGGLLCPSSPGYTDGLCGGRGREIAGVKTYCIDQQGGKGGANYTEDITPPLLCDSHGTPHAVAYHESTDRCILDDQGGQQISIRTDGKSPTLRAEMHGNIPVVLQAAGFKAGNGAKANGIGWQKEVSPPLVASPSGTNQVPAVVYDARGNGDGQTVNTVTGDHNSRITDYTSVVVETKVYDRQKYGIYAATGKASTLKANGYKDVGDMVVAGLDCRNGRENGDLCGTLQSKPNGGFSYNVTHPVRIGHLVRRLTPTECERLQGFPDGWTDIGDWVDSKGKKHKEAASPRYKALGNSIAIPPWKWVLKRLCACYERDATMASLFDGIGGFPYIWEQLNGKGSCLWASEIEEFPMAVTKLRFGG